MGWRAAPSVAAMFSQANALWPDRDHRSDGTIGDAAHQAEPTSDHNPDDRGIVHAGDVTHGPYWGSAHMDCRPLAEAIRARKDPRLKYMIFQERICSGQDGPYPWVWRAYHGTSPHREHLHVSIRYTKGAEDDTSAWWTGAHSTPGTREATVNLGAMPVLHSGMKDDDQDLPGDPVSWLQDQLRFHGQALTVTGVFDSHTVTALKAFQHRVGIDSDGVAGTQTYEWLLPLLRR